MRMRVMDLGMVPAIRSQAVFHGVAETMDADSDPVLLLVSPQTPYVCVGMHQQVDREVDEDFCKAHDLPVYRRHVGGGAVYLDKDQYFTHFIFPKDKAPKRADQLYPLFIEPVVRTYREFGIPAQFRPANDIHVNGRKIGGTGAASIGDATVMVGSFMFDFDTETMSRCLKVPSEKFRDKLRTTLDDYMTTMVKELKDVPTRERLRDAFLAHCAAVLNVTPEMDSLNERELAAIAESEKQLADPEWTYMQGRKFVEMGVKISAGTHLTESAHKAPGGLIRINLLARDGRIDDLMIAGDFTCLPPLGVDDMAALLRGKELNAVSLEAAIVGIVESLGIEMPGITPRDIATAIMMAYEPPE
ncbi:MAG TPA: lipoate--protein ligase family protein [Devosia sp.]|nr:lipoate--protein ligase family protein [Devosia sp.]